MHGRSDRTSTGVVHYEGLPPSPPECRPDLPSRPLSASTSTPDRPKRLRYIRGPDGLSTGIVSPMAFPSPSPTVSAVARS